MLGVKACASWAWEVVDRRMVAAGAGGAAHAHFQKTDGVDVGTGDAAAEVDTAGVQRVDMGPCGIAGTGRKKDGVAPRDAGVLAALSHWMRWDRH